MGLSRVGGEGRFGWVGMYGGMEGGDVWMEVGVGGD